MKVIDRLTKRLDHMVPETFRRNQNPKEIADYLKALKDEETAIKSKLKKTK